LVYYQPTALLLQFVILKYIMPGRKFFKIESWKWKIENCGRADSLQNANHCRPTVFLYIEVVFKCRGEPCSPVRVQNCVYQIKT